MPLAHGLTNPSPPRERLVRAAKRKAARKNAVKHKDCLPALVLDNSQLPTSPMALKADAI